MMLKLLCFAFIYVSAVNSHKVQMAFEAAEIVPDVVSQAPRRLLKIEYENNVKVNKGNTLATAQLQNSPIKIDYKFEENAFYTLIMTDPDAPSRANPQMREFNHWLVVNIPGNDVNRGTTLAAYMGPRPPQGSGLHRYIFLLYKQTGVLRFDEPYRSNTNAEGRAMFRAANFSAKYNLGSPLAGNFFQTEY